MNVYRFSVLFMPWYFGLATAAAFEFTYLGLAAQRNLSADNPAWDSKPAYSPDGKTLAWLAMARPGFEADRFRLVMDRSFPSGHSPTDRGSSRITSRS